MQLGQPPPDERANPGGKSEQSLQHAALQTGAAAILGPRQLSASIVIILVDNHVHCLHEAAARCKRLLLASVAASMAHAMAAAAATRAKKAQREGTYPRGLKGAVVRPGHASAIASVQDSKVTCVRPAGSINLRPALMIDCPPPVLSGAFLEPRVKHEVQAQVSRIRARVPIHTSVTRRPSVDQPVWEVRPVMATHAASCPAACLHVSWILRAFSRVSP